METDKRQKFLREDLKRKYETCETYVEHRLFKAQAHDEISYENIFDTFLPGQTVEMDFAIKGNQNYLCMCTYRVYASVQNQQPEHQRGAKMPQDVGS